MALNAAALPQESTVGDYIALLKPGVMSLVVFTGAVGMYLAPGHLHPVQQLLTVLCIAIASGASGAINMWYDRDIDAHMRRTAARPIPAGRVMPEEALAFGIVLSVASVMLMGLGVNWLASALLLSAILFYVFIYTFWLKRRTPQNIVIGGAAGAFPPMIGWAAASGEISVNSVLLFLIIFLWTPPHFWSLALYRCGDYAKVGVPMLPVVAGDESTRRHVLGYTIILAVVSLLPYYTGLSGVIYLVGATLLNGVFLYHAFRLWWRPDSVKPIEVFKFSIIYLFVLFSLLLVDAAWMVKNIPI